MYISDPSLDTLLEKLSSNHLNLVMIAEHSQLNTEDLIQRCNQEKIKVAGGIFPMIIGLEDPLEKGVILKHFPAESEAILIRNIDSDFSELLPEMDQNWNSSIVFVDGLSAHIPNFLDTLYEKYWSHINYVGGGAGSLSLEQKPCIFTNEGLFEDAGFIIPLQWDSKIGIKHGWEKIAGPFIANKAVGNRVIELNWRPAFEVYKEVVEQYSSLQFKEDNFFDIAKGFPFGIYREDQEDIVRDPITVDEDGTLICVGKVSQNASLNILKGEKEHLIKNAELAGEIANEPKAKELFIADCISRVLYLEDDFKAELVALRKGLKDVEKNLVGVLCLGEVSSNDNGYLEFFNKTTVVSTFY